jgi:hypothetical protein
MAFKYLESAFIKSLVSVSLAAALVTSANGETLIHSYQLNGDFTDALGGPALAPTGALGTFSATDYSFAQNSGLSLSNAISTSNYSILINFQFAADSGYRKIIDFKNLTSDEGLYNLSQTLNFYPVASNNSTTLLAGQNASVLLTRDGSTGAVNGYVNGALMLSFTDASNLATFSEPQQIIHFFQDDIRTGGRESSAGIVDSICIFDGAISSDGASNASCNVISVVPEPSEWAMMILGLGLIGSIARRRQLGEPRKSS